MQTTKKKPFLATLVLALVMLLGGCETAPTRGAATRIDDTMKDSAQTNRGAVPQEITDALLPPLEINLPKGGKTSVEPRFDLTVNNASAPRVFMGIVEGTRYGMVVAPEVGGTVTLNLRNVTVPEAMEAIRRVYGYGFSRDGNRFYVTGRGIQTRLFQVNYLNFKRKGMSSTFVTAGGLSKPGGGSGSTSSSSTATGTTTSGSSSRSASISVATETETDFWKDLETAIKTIVGEGKDKRVIVNPQTNLVIVRAAPGELRVVEEFLGVTAETVARQVVLEAKILEVELNDRFQAGVNWAALTTVNGANLTFGQTGGGSAFNSGTGLTGTAGTALGNLAPGAGAFTPAGGTATSAFGGVFAAAVESGNFNAFVEALKGQGEVQVLSSPRVSTVNNQKAVIKVGADEFFVTGISVTAGAVGAAQTAYEYEPFFSGIALDVSPQISENGEIVLHIHPTISEVSTQNKPVPGGLQAPFARSVVQESDNVVRAKSGQVIVIAGLMKEAATDDNASVPFLGNIPLAGNLFKQKRVIRVKKELIILLKPTLVNLDQEWATMIDDSKKRMDGIRKGF